LQIILDVGVQDASQPTLVADDEVIDAFAANRADHAATVSARP